MRYHSYLNSAAAILKSYPGDQPFAGFLKKYFSANKKFGSRDRKQITSVCYNYFRLGKGLPGLPIEEKVIAAVFLCEKSANDFLNFHKPEWNTVVSKPLSEKLRIAELSLADVFPWAIELSAGIEFESFGCSFFDQPDLFLRLRPGKQQIVINKLKENDILFNQIADDCLVFPNGTKLDRLIKIDEEAIIQDHSSQQVLNYLKKQSVEIALPVRVWDCCAASGGKSILANDLLSGEIDLSVSDIRENILRNLSKRFEIAGIKKYKTFKADLTSPVDESGIANLSPQLIICDAPCSGSGTWSRTPEQLAFFKVGKIEEYAALQRKIVSNAIPVLQKGGLFFYITCSVFGKENEQIAEFIKEKFHLRLLQMELINGYDKKADSMFVAAFKKE